MATADGAVAVTGAGGYLGGRLCAALGPVARPIVRATVPWLPEAGQRPCDLLAGPDALTGALSGAEVLVHLAGHNEVLAAADPDRARRETEAMAATVAQAAVAVGVRRIVYVSTVHVYGEHLRPGATITTDTPVAPTSAYARARADCEALLATSGPELVVLRLTNAVGAPADPMVDRWTLVASDLCRSAVLDRRMRLLSTGLQWRDFIVLEDACRLIAGALDGAVPAGTYNLASGRSATVRALAELVQDRVEARCGWRPALEGPAPDGEPDEPYTVDVSGLAQHGLDARLALEEGVDDIIEHCSKHEAALRGGTVAS